MEKLTRAKTTSPLALAVLDQILRDTDPEDAHEEFLRVMRGREAEAEAMWAERFGDQ